MDSSVFLLKNAKFYNWRFIFLQKNKTNWSAKILTYFFWEIKWAWWIYLLFLLCCCTTIYPIPTGSTSTQESSSLTGLVSTYSWAKKRKHSKKIWHNIESNSLALWKQHWNILIWKRKLDQNSIWLMISSTCSNSNYILRICIRKWIRNWFKLINIFQFRRGRKSNERFSF